MIFDWEANSMKVLAEGRLSASDDWEARRAFAQELALLRHLIFSKGMGKAEARSVWDGLSGGTAESLAFDPPARDRAFEAEWEAASGAGPNEPLPTVAVTRQEAEYLNSLQAPLDVRRYWIRLLAYVKTKRAMGRTPKDDPRVDSWLMRSAGMPGRRDDEVRRARMWSLRCGVPFPQRVVPYAGGAVNAYFPGWLGGDPAWEGRLGEFDGLDELLDPGSFLCPRCGTRFERAPRAKTDLCPDCAAEARREAQRGRMRARRKKDVIGN